MPENVYDRGDEVVLATVITDTRTKAPVDPATVAVTVRKPDKTIVTPTVSHDGLGTYEASVIADQTGRWFYQWSTTGGDYVGADERHFSVRPSAF
jgi:uncharacterized protein YfaS (alpha-2-macroglobulin family)